MTARWSRLKTGRGIAWWGLIVGVGALALWYGLQSQSSRRELRHLVGSMWVPGARVAFTDVLADLWDAYLVPGATPDVPGSEDRTLVFGGIPQALGFPPGSVKTWTNRAYAVGYSDSLRCPVWVAYRVGGTTRLARGVPRPDQFLVDRRTSARVHPDAYLRTGFDRGHLAPNLAIGLWFGEEAQRETFLMSNVAPQSQSLNRGAWRALEARVAYSYPARLEEVWVFCGPLFDPVPKRLNVSGIAIPEAFYLLVVDVSAGRIRSMALIVPQNAETTASLSHWLVSIDEVERRSGLDFFPSLDKSVENRLESKISASVW